MYRFISVDDAIKQTITGELLGIQDVEEFAVERYKTEPHNHYRYGNLFQAKGKLKNLTDNERAYMDREGQNALFSFYAEQYPGCCGTLVVHDFGTQPEYVFRPQLRASIDAKRIVPLLLPKWEEIAKLTGYTTLQYSTVKSQIVLEETIKARQFTPISTYRSQRTGAYITMWSKQVA